MLKAFNKMPSIYRAVVLIVGAPGVGKHQLAKALVAAGNNQPPLQVRTVTHLPLPEETQSRRPRIDFIIFMVDQTNRQSFMTVKQSLQFLDLTYMMGKICFVLTQVNNTICRSVSFGAIRLLADSCRSQLLCCNMQNAEELKCTAHQLIYKLYSSVGLKNSVTDLLIECTKSVKPAENSVTL